MALAHHPDLLKGAQPQRQVRTISRTLPAVPDTPKPLHLRWAILGPPLASALTLAVIAAVGTTKGNDPALWLRPAVLAAGGQVVLLWWSTGRSGRRHRTSSPSTAEIMNPAAE
jgi:hypothetical protein